MQQRLHGVSVKGSAAAAAVATTTTAAPVVNPRLKNYLLGVVEQQHLAEV